MVAINGRNKPFISVLSWKLPLRPQSHFSCCAHRSQRKKPYSSIEYYSSATNEKLFQAWSLVWNGSNIKYQQKSSKMVLCNGTMMQLTLCKKKIYKIICIRNTNLNKKMMIFRLDLLKQMT